MTIQMLGKKVAVLKTKKGSKSKDNFLSVPENDEFYGVVRHVGPEVTNPDISVGANVYFLNQSQLVRMNGEELMVMDDSNIVATLKP